MVAVGMGTCSESCSSHAKDLGIGRPASRRHRPRILNTLGGLERNASWRDLCGTSSEDCPWG